MLEILNCPSNITRYVYQNEGTSDVTWTDPTAIGAFGPPRITPPNIAPGQYFFYVGNPVTITYTFYDNFERPHTCSFTVNVKEGKCSSSWMCLRDA